jgi:putative endonuclease
VERKRPVKEKKRAKGREIREASEEKGTRQGILIESELGIRIVQLLDKQPAVYILASQRNGTLYIGVTSDLVKRIGEHKNNLVEGFSKRYGVHQLVWYELHENMESAINREKQIKEWKRKWKLELIEDTNRNWQDLYYTVV